MVGHALAAIVVVRGQDGAGYTRRTMCRWRDGRRGLSCGHGHRRCRGRQWSIGVWFELHRCQVMVPGGDHLHLMLACEHPDRHLHGCKGAVRAGVRHNHRCDRGVVHRDSERVSIGGTGHLERRIINACRADSHRIGKPFARPHVSNNRSIHACAVLDVHVIGPVGPTQVTRGGVMVPDTFAATVIVSSPDHTGDHRGPKGCRRRHLGQSRIWQRDRNNWRLRRRRVRCRSRQSRGRRDRTDIAVQRDLVVRTVVVGDHLCRIDTGHIDLKDTVLNRPWIVRVVLAET